jgi:hypothetical protein
VSISRRARASAQSLVCTKLCAPDPASLPPRRDLLGLGPLSRSFLRLGSRSRSRAILPALSPHDVTRVGDPGELGPLPLGYFSLEGAQHVGWGFRARVGAARRRPRSSRPMSAAHGCCFQRRSPHVSAHAASSCSHTMRGLADSRRNARFGEPSDGAEVLSPSTTDRAGVPLMLRRSRASPAERCPPASARDRITISGRKTLEPRPTPPSRVNGCLGLALARSTLSLRSLFVRIGDPIRALPWLRSFETKSLSRRSLTRGERSFCRVTDPRGTSACPQSSRCCSALLSKRGTASGLDDSVPGTAPSTGGATSPRRPLRSRSLGPLRTRAHATLATSPDELGTDTLRHRRMTTRDGSSLASSPPTEIRGPKASRSGAFPCRSRRDRSPLCYPTKALPKKRLRSDDVFFTPGSTRP